MHANADLPNDPALPAVVAIRSLGLAGAIPAMHLGNGPCQIQLRAHKPGERATLEVRAGERHFAVKASAYDPSGEAALYEAFGAASLDDPSAGTGPVAQSGIRVPPLLHWDRELRVLVLGWLEGPTAQQLVKRGDGERPENLALAGFGVLPPYPSNSALPSAPRACCDAWASGSIS